MIFLKKAISMFLALSLTLTFAAVNAFAASIEPAFIVQMVGNTLTMFKDGKPFAPYQISTEHAKDGLTMKQNAKGDLIMTFVDSTGRLRRINIGNEKSIALQGTFPSFKVDRSVNNRAISLSTHDKADLSAIPTVVKELVVRGAVALNIAPNATVNKAQLSNPRASVTLDKGANVKKIEAASGVAVDGTGKSGVKIDRPATSTPSSGGGSSDSSGSSGGSGGGNPPTPPIGTKVAAPIVALDASNPYSAKFSLSDIADIDGISVATTPDTLADGGATYYIVDDDFVENDFMNFISPFDVLRDYCNGSAGGPQTLYFQSIATPESGKLNSDIVTFSNQYQFTEGAALGNLEYTYAAIDTKYTLTVTGVDITKDTMYCIGALYVAADGTEHLWRSTSPAEADGTVEFRTRGLQGSEIIKTLTVYQQNSISMSNNLIAMDFSKNVATEAVAPLAELTIPEQITQDNIDEVPVPPVSDSANENSAPPVSDGDITSNVPVIPEVPDVPETSDTSETPVSDDSSEASADPVVPQT